MAPLQDLVQRQESTIAELNAKLQEREASEVEEKSSKGVKDLMDIYDDAGADDDKYESLSNRQMIDVITKSVDKAINNQRQSAAYLIDNALKQDRARVAEIEKATMGILANLSVSEARRKHSDFDNYSEDIKVAMQKHPGLDFEDAYYLAKSKKASSVPSVEKMETEKPDNFATSRGGMRSSSAPKGDVGNPGGDDMEIISRRGRMSDSQPSNQSGVVGFRSLLDSAIDEVLG